MQYPYGKQHLNKEDIESVVRVLNSEFITQGPITPQFEEEINKYVRSKYSLAISSATAGLHLSCLALGLNKDSIVWTTPISFVATSNSALYCKSKVEFIDIDYSTGNMDINLLEEKLEQANKKNKLPNLLIIVHLAGSPLDMKRVYELKIKYNFSIIEDASHALGAEYFGFKVGCCRYSDLSVFSFHPVKMITTGEGGAITTNNKLLYEKCKLLRSHGIEKDPQKMKDKQIGLWKYEQQMLGYNYRISDINTALGLSQIKRLDSIIKKRRELINQYNSLFEGYDAVKIITEIKHTRSSYHLALMRLRKVKKLSKYKYIFESLRSKGLGVQLHYYPIHLQYFYKKLGWNKGDFPVAEKYAFTTLSIPLYETLEDKDISKIVRLIKETLD